MAYYKKVKKEFTYTVKEEIATLSEEGNVRKMLTLTAWGDHEEKYDIRTWVGNSPKKGITLSEAEVVKLEEALKKEFPEAKKKKAINKGSVTKKEAKQEDSQGNILDSFNLQNLTKEQVVKVFNAFSAQFPKQ